jgi:hypothetical protein
LVDGSIVFAWDDAWLASESAVLIRHYSAGGEPQGLPYPANPLSGDWAGGGQLARLSTGGFVAVWRAFTNAPPYGTFIYGQLFGADGTKLPLP